MTDEEWFRAQLVQELKASRMAERMSRRERIATAALSGVIAAEGPNVGTRSAIGMAQNAVELADALIAALDGKEDE